MLRTVLDILILSSRQLLATAVLLWLAWLAVSRWPPARRAAARFADHQGRRFLMVAAVVSVIGFVGVGIWYASLDAFACEVEPQVASVAWVQTHGQPIYHSLDAAARYSVLYGPSVYLATGLFLRILGPSIVAAKIGSLLAILAAMIFLYSTLRDRLQRRSAIVLTAFAGLAYWTAGTSAYLVRPDAYLLAAVGGGYLAAVRAPRILAWIGLAAALAFAVNLKMHAGLYFLPAIAWLAQRHGRRALLATAVLALALVLAPFWLYRTVSLTHYLRWVEAALEHGLDPTALPSLLSYALFFSLPLGLVLLAGGRVAVRPRDHRALVGVYALAVATAIIPASKPGAGLVHLLPLATAATVLTGQALADLQSRGRADRLLRSGLLGGVGAVVVVALIGGWTTEYRDVMLARFVTSEAAGIRQDLRAILASYPDRTVAMGYGGEGIYFQRTYLRPLLIFAGEPLLLDVIAMMDAECAEVALSPATLDAIEEGRIGVWLVPSHQPPFVKQNWYPPHEEVFPPAFRDRFRRAYRLDRRTPYFDCYAWGETAATSLDSQPRGELHGVAGINAENPKGEER